MDKGLQSNEVRIPKPEFDVKSGIQCQYFQSSFARSLMLNQSNCTRSLDIPLNFEDSSPMLEKSSEKIEKSANEFNVEENLSPQSGDSNDLTPMDVKDLWLNSQCLSPRKSPDSAECEVLRLRKKCQNLVEENRRLLNVTHNGSSTPSVETMILQNKVDTLKWQMQQIESSRQMYRALMESVAHFLERCHMSLDAMQQKESLCRSKSALQMIPHDLEVPATSSPTRPRSSSNMSDLELHLPPHRPEDLLENSMDSIQSVPSSYSNFRDFTWRRSPKRRIGQSPTSGGATMEVDKLSQEAFRLLRNVKNLLNTQEPMLSQAKSVFDDSLTFVSATAKDTNPLNLLFGRKVVKRESRCSLRSTSDSNSTASSKPETDEELPERPSPIPCRTSSNLKVGGCIEDESGFSSMSSFQEIGLPLISSTQRSSSVSSDSTAPDSDPPASFAKVGLPLTHFHRRWDSAPAVPPKNGALFCSRIRPEDEGMRVLWV
uniref:Putative lateral signaling target protein 2 n=1 Tax=Lutzomyia longipalpis TaxID=7200 RepID=A0A1B0CGT1_LUTLO